MIKVADLKRSQDVLNLNAILRQAFAQSKDIHRVRGKIDRGSPDLTPEESEAIAGVLRQNDVWITTEVIEAN